MRKGMSKTMEMLNKLQEREERSNQLGKELAGEAETAEEAKHEVPNPPNINWDEDDYKSNSETFDISFVEFAIINGYLHSVYRKANPPLTITHFGDSDGVGRVSFGAAFDVSKSFWFMGHFDNDNNTYIFHTNIFKDGHGALITQLHVSVKKGVKHVEIEAISERIKKLAFNNSEYTGKCIKIKLHEGRFKGIEAIEMKRVVQNLILSPTQLKYIASFTERVRRGRSVRYLLNGEPGTGKTETIRKIIGQLIPDVTFIIPDFDTTDDLTVILEACEIFDRAVIIMDDIDLYLGSRENGSYTRLLGEFLSFFDGVKKRKISLLASTNDKGLVDKAAERPGRFNMTLDYTFLTSEQIVEVCKIHLDPEYHIEEVYKALSQNIGGKKANITGAFISNLAENIREMSEDNEKWTIEDALDLIIESYKGFYSSQIEKTNKLGFAVNSQNGK